MPVLQITDLDPMSRIRKRNRIVVHSADVPKMFSGVNVSMRRRRCLAAFVHGWFEARWRIARLGTHKAIECTLNNGCL
jgi:hypothetical protein